MNKKKLTLSLVMLVLAVGILLSSVTYAMATTKYNVNTTGDKWNYGTNLITVKIYSNYTELFGQHWASSYNPETTESNRVSVGFSDTAKSKVTSPMIKAGILACGLGN